MRMPERLKCAENNKPVTDWLFFRPSFVFAESLLRKDSLLFDRVNFELFFTVLMFVILNQEFIIMHIPANRSTEVSQQAIRHAVQDPSNSSMQSVTPQSPRMRSLAGTTVQSAGINALPRDIKFRILQQLPHTVLFDASLFSLASTCLAWRADVKTFLKMENACIAFGGKALRAEVVATWKACGQQLIEQAPVLQAAFKTSRKLIAQAIFSSINDDTLLDALTQLPAVALDFRLMGQADNLRLLLGKLPEKPVKILASEIGRQRFVDDVLPTLAQISAQCPVVLDASCNDLKPNDLHLLVLQMHKNASIVQLDLSGNQLCFGNIVCEPLLALFHTPTALSHLYLAHTNLNDQTACQISESLTHNPCLRHLDLRFNSLVSTGVMALIHSLAYFSESGSIHTNTNLKALRLQGNLYGQSKETLFSAIDTVHRLVASTQPERAQIVQLDTVHGHTDPSFNTLLMQQNQFDTAASAEKL